jgi:hypothetical protein
MPPRTRRRPAADVGEAILAAAFQSLQGKPASTDTFRDIANGSIRCALLWIDALLAVTAPLNDGAIAEIVRDIAVAQLRDIRQNGDRIEINLPPAGKLN